MQPTKYISEINFLSRYHSEEACLRALLDARAGDNRSCLNPRCPGGNMDYHYRKMKERKGFQCVLCLKQVYPMAGTIFQDTHVPINTWFKIIFEMLESRNGVAAKEIQRKYGIAYRPVLRMTHLIRSLMKGCLPDKFENTIVEIDESFVKTGFKGFGRHHKFKRGRGSERNSTILTIAQRGGPAILIPILMADEETILEKIEERVDKSSMIITDSYKPYNKLKMLGFRHETVNHEKEWKNGMACTNQAEGIFSRFKKNIKGSHSKVSHNKLPLYCIEHAFRYSFRLEPDYGFSRLLKVIPLFERINFEDVN